MSNQQHEVTVAEKVLMRTIQLLAGLTEYQLGVLLVETSDECLRDLGDNWTESRQAEYIVKACLLLKEKPWENN
jgi:hypothetical protein